MNKQDGVERAKRKTIKAYGERYGFPVSAREHTAVGFGFDAGLAHQSQWRRVEDEMPPHDGDYLCTVQLPQECGNVWVRQEVVGCSMNKFPEKVIAWMPLPEPYKGENE